MASIRKRTWETKKGTTTRYELSYYQEGVQKKVVFKKKPTPQEMYEATQTIKNTDITLETLANDYLNLHCNLHCKQSTRELYQSYIDNSLANFKCIKIQKITKKDVEKLLLNMRLTKSDKTINNILIFIKSLFNYAITNGLLDKNPAKDIKKITLTKKKAKALNEEQIEVFIEEIEKLPIKMFVFFSIMLYTGARISEVLGLNWSDINFKEKKINITKQYYKGRLTNTKTYEERTIDIPDNLNKLLIKYKKSLKDTYPILFSNESGNYLNVGNIRDRYFNNIKKRMEDNLEIELDGITPHSLRHTHATFLLSNGVPIKCVSERLGHKDCKTTLNIYNHVLQSSNDKAMELLEKMNKSEKRAKKNKSQ